MPAGSGVDFEAPWSCLITTTWNWKGKVDRWGSIYAGWIT